MSSSPGYPGKVPKRFLKMDNIGTRIVSMDHFPKLPEAAKWAAFPAFRSLRLEDHL